ncbi:hypothetical protein PR048_022313 [Dryococelus australis]|uniref:Uncharacterized protein n=1 Tax=Dryococelus australis TaxID=614101 RepID=A0ABQ9H0Q4_9NEOP|nr:hypothetical protein PR048_022313 [Dryococelus australis]
MQTYMLSTNMGAKTSILDNHTIGLYILPHRLKQNNYCIFLCEVLPKLLDDVPLYVRLNMWLQHGMPTHNILQV